MAAETGSGKTGVRIYAVSFALASIRTLSIALGVLATMNVVI